MITIWSAEEQERAPILWSVDEPVAGAIAAYDALLQYGTALIEWPAAVQLGPSWCGPIPCRVTKCEEAGTAYALTLELACVMAPIRRCKGYQLSMAFFMVVCGANPAMVPWRFGRANIIHGYLEVMTDAGFQKMRLEEVARRCELDGEIVGCEVGFRGLDVTLYVECDELEDRYDPSYPPVIYLG